MKASSWIFLLVGLLFLIGMASAAPFIMTGNSSKAWLTANGVDQATITINVKNTTSNTNVAGAIVTFTVVDTTYGSFSSSPVTTDANGNAASNFIVKTRSGIATITAEAKYTDSSTAPPTVFTQQISFNQNIDHDSPYKAQFVYLLNATVKSNVPFDAYLLDRWNNPIDDRKPSEIHNVTLHVHGPGSDDCGFEVGTSYPHDITKILDASGHTAVTVNLTSAPGSNTVMMDRLGSMGDQYKTIDAVANGIVYYISPVYSPDNPARMSVSSDPADVFEIHYTLYDRFMNPTRDQQAWINTTDNIGTLENYTLQTSLYNGQIWTKYGPKPLASQWVISITPVSNQSAVNLDTNTYPVKKTLEFISTDPTNLELTITPQMMASLDVPTSDGSIRYANLTAKVVDDLGNPVGGETVTFEIAGTPVYSPDSLCKANDSSFDPYTPNLSVTAVTGGDGTVTLKIYPGSFVSNRSDLNFEPTATGSVEVVARWGAVERPNTLVWKNYPYLSAVTKITPNQVQVGDTIDVDLQLNGDGWALQRKPIDVVLVTDRSGSMSGSKMTGAIAAGKAFVDAMGSQDEVGLVSFGSRPTGGYYASVDRGKTLLASTTDRTNVKNTIDSYAAGGNTPMREAIYNGTVTEEKAPRVDVVKALIVMTDGEWNDGGDPAGAWGARSWTDPPFDYTVTSGTNVVTWSNSKGIKLYFIGLGVTSSYNTTLQNYATWGGGKYFYAPSGSQLTAIYQQIAGELVEEAGVNTTASMDFGSILVNDKYDTSGAVFEYVGDPTVLNPVKPYLTNYPTMKAPGSTMVDLRNKSINTSAGPTELFHFRPGKTFTDIGPLIINQTTDWNNPDPAYFHKLKFDIGTVKVNETWETNFRLRVLKEGTITLMGSSSKVCFEDPEDPTAPESCMSLDNQSSVSSSWVPHFDPTHYQTMSVDTVACDPSTSCGTGELVDFFGVTWTTTYSGTKPVTEDVYYKHDTDPNVLIKSVTWDPGAHAATPTVTHANTALLSMASKPLGSYKIIVHAHSADAEDTGESPAYELKGAGGYFIKLE